jgi:polyisoprenoid-binding protein YceI
LLTQQTALDEEMHMTQDTTTATLTGDYDLDVSHSRLGFAAKHAMVATVRGQFTKWSGTVHLDEDNIANSTARLEIDASSVTTGNDDRDAHVKAEDFFHVEKHPTITFVSTGAEAKGDDEFVLTGDLTIRDTTKSVSIDFEKTGTSVDPWGGHRVGFEGKTKVSRKDWGLSFNVPLDGGGVLVSDKVTLEFDIALVRKA